MTDMTPEAINDMLARWVGFEGSGLSNTFNDPPNSNPYHCHILPTPDYFHTNVAVDLLVVLVERGYKVDVQSDGPQWSMVLQHPDMKRAICSLRDTIPAAICTAIIELIEREGKE